MERKSLKEELRETIDDLRGLIHKICTKENASSGELAVVPELANSITRMTGYAWTSFTLTPGIGCGLRTHQRN